MKTSEALRELALFMERRPEAFYAEYATKYSYFFDPCVCDPPEGTVARWYSHITRDEIVLRLCLEACIAEDFGD